MTFDLTYFLRITNDTITAVIAIVSASMLLYNLSRNLHSRVARASSVLLACVTIVSMIDVVTSLDAAVLSLQVWLRVQWVGIAFAPAAMFHLSDALLSTTGLVSRGRRRRVVRRLYYLSTLFLILALFTDVLVVGVSQAPALHLLAGPIFALYVAYFIVATIVSVYNVRRARQRCLTTYTHRRMGYLLYSFTLPAFGIFPYSLLFTDSGSSVLLFWLLVNVSNIGIALMLLFIAYPISLFGSNIPDRVVKAELLRFFLRGPFTGILVLVIIIYLPQAGHILGLPGEEFMPFAAVAVVMFWQWMVSLFLPRLERFLVYADDQSQMQMVQAVSQRLLTQSDLKQLFEAILAAACDLLQVPVGFMAAFEGEQVRLESVVGRWQPGDDWANGAALFRVLPQEHNGDTAIVTYQQFWVVPLYSDRIWDAGNNNGTQRLLGALAVQAPPDGVMPSPEEALVFDSYVDQAAQALDDQLLQKEVFAALEGLLPEMEAIQQFRDAARYGMIPARVAVDSDNEAAPSSDFVKAVRDALRDYWGGPRLTQSGLVQLAAVQHELTANDNNATRALRSVLLEAINRLRPEGDRSMTGNEWTLYNIVELRFVQGYKVRDVAKRLAVSEADLYRKQRLAIEEVARTLAHMEQEVQNQRNTSDA